MTTSECNANPSEEAEVEGFAVAGLLRVGSLSAESKGSYAKEGLGVIDNLAVPFGG